MGDVDVESEGALCFAIERGQAKLKPVELGGAHALEQGAEQVGIELADAVKDVGPGRRQGDELGATVDWVLVAIEVAVLHEPVDEPADRGRPDVQVLSQRRHADPWMNGRKVETLGLRHGDVHPHELRSAPAGDMSHEGVEVLEDGANGPRIGHSLLPMRIITMTRKLCMVRNISDPARMWSEPVSEPVTRSACPDHLP
jgi:hypothetical protein